jgi:thiaminase/transcriptional activator TenA
MARPTLTEELWAGIESVFGAIVGHPFIVGLTDGSLGREAFRFYVVQDALYLREFARALAVTGARAPGEDDVVMFCRHATGALEVERALHEGLFRDLGLGERKVAATPLAPTTLAYTSYLLRVAYGGSFAEALAALLPCYWIYQRVGGALLERGSPDPLYRRWIDTYGGEEFAVVVAEVLASTDRLGAEVGVRERERMRQRFQTSARYEWMFWEMGYRQEHWPI